MVAVPKTPSAQIIAPYSPTHARNTGDAPVSPEYGRTQRTRSSQRTAAVQKSLSVQAPEHHPQLTRTLRSGSDAAGRSGAKGDGTGSGNGSGKGSGDDHTKNNNSRSDGTSAPDPVKSSSVSGKQTTKTALKQMSSVSAGSGTRGGRGTKTTTKPKRTTYDGEAYYNVESIIGHRFQAASHPLFIVRWAGYSETTEEPAESFIGLASERILRDYCQTQADAAPPGTTLLDLAHFHRDA
ncbi:hypothetical protein MBLNU459_g5524t1 [Dothideomycetes sp. NU459]